MILKRCNMKAFSEYCKDKTIACYGIGGEFERILKNYEVYAWTDRIGYLVDSNPARAGTVVTVKGKEQTIRSLWQFLEEDLSDVVIFVTCTAYAEVVGQLNGIWQLDQVE